MCSEKENLTISRDVILIMHVKWFRQGYTYSRSAPRHSDSDPFASYRDRFRTIVVFAGQDAVAGENVEFLVEAARKNPETLFIYVPRTDNPGVPAGQGKSCSTDRV